jgi:hypothetical protein
MSLSTNYHSAYHTDKVLVAFKTLIKQACHEANTEPNIQANLTICDNLTQFPTLAGRAVRTLDKLISQKNDQTALNALNLLDYVIKNCAVSRPTFASAGLLKSMIKALPKQIREPNSVKNHMNLPESTSQKQRLQRERWDRTLVLIQQWGTVLDNLEAFTNAYQGLLDRNVHFPVPENGEELVLLDAKRANGGVPRYYDQPPQPQQPQQQQQQQQQPQQRAPVEVKAIPDNELVQVVQNLVEITRDMLTASSPTEDLSKNALVAEQLGQLKYFQGRVVGKISRGELSEDHMALMLVLNDEVDHVHKYYNGLIRGTATRTADVKMQLVHKSLQLGGGRKEESRPSSPPTVQGEADDVNNNAVVSVPQPGEVSVSAAEQKKSKKRLSLEERFDPFADNPMTQTPSQSSGDANGGDQGLDAFDPLTPVQANVGQPPETQRQTSLNTVLDGLFAAPPAAMVALAASLLPPPVQTTSVPAPSAAQPLAMHLGEAEENGNPFLQAANTNNPAAVVPGSAPEEQAMLDDLFGEPEMQSTVPVMHQQHSSSAWQPA